MDKPLLSGIYLLIAVAVLAVAGVLELVLVPDHSDIGKILLGSIVTLVVPTQLRKAAPILILGFLPFMTACMTPADYLKGAWELTSEACFQRQDNQVDEANTQEEAEEAVAGTRAKCDIAYDGFRASASILEVVIDE